MENDKTYQQAVEKHRGIENSRAVRKRFEFIFDSRCFVSKAKEDVAMLVVTGEIEDPSDILENLNRLDELAIELLPKQIADIKTTPWGKTNP